MKIFPITYSQVNTAIKAGLIVVSIDRTPPPGFRGRHYLPLSPFTYMNSPFVHPSTFQLDYGRILSDLDISKVISDIKKLAQGRDVAICATTAPGKDFINPAIEWLKAGGVTVAEFEVKDANNIQTQMF